MTKRIDAGDPYTDIVPEGTPFPTILSETDYSPTRAQIVDGAVANKPSVKTVGVDNVDLATDVDNGKTLSGHVLQTGDPFLLKGQTNGAQNGPWITSASGAPVRPTWAADGYTLALKAGDTIRCTEGFYARTTWHLTTVVPIIVGTTAQTWAPIGQSFKTSNEDTTVGSIQKGYFLAPSGNGDFSNMALSANRSYEYRMRWPYTDAGMIGLSVFVTTAVPGSRFVLAVYRLSEDLKHIERSLRDNTLVGDSTGEQEITFTKIPFYLGEPFTVGLFCDDAVSVRRVNNSFCAFTDLYYTDQPGGSAIGFFRSADTTFEEVFPDPHEIGFQSALRGGASTIPVITVKAGV